MHEPAAALWCTVSAVVSVGLVEHCVQIGHVDNHMTHFKAFDWPILVWI